LGSDIGIPGYVLLFPGEITPIHARFMDPITREIGDVIITLEGRVMGPEEIARNDFLASLTHDLEVVRVEGRVPEAGAYQVLGEVRNTSGVDLAEVEVSIMLFDADDHLLAVDTLVLPDNFVFDGGSQLRVGETTTFEAWFRDFAGEGDVVRIEVQVGGEKVR